MAYITPNTDIHILRNCPLDSDYSHTIYFETAADQYAYFYSLKAYSYSNYSYQRSGKGKIRIGVLADVLYGCNYMMFQNTSYKLKWFYAFIDHIDYINDNACEITYSIDKMQTYLFDYEMPECYVEREHTESDNLYEHLVPEDIATGELIVNTVTNACFPISSAITEPKYALLVNYVPNEQIIVSESYNTQSGKWVFTTASSEDSFGQIVHKTYNGFATWDVDMPVNYTQAEIADTVKHITNLIDRLVEIGAVINSIIQVPYQMKALAVGTVLSNYVLVPKDIDFEHPTHKASMKYTPKNAKMYSYPYQSIVVSNNNGNTATYKWEDFSSFILGQAKFIFDATIKPSAELMLYPNNYRGLTNDYESGLILTEFPTPTWDEDSFARWFAQNGTSYYLGLVSSAINNTGRVALGIGQIYSGENHGGYNTEQGVAGAATDILNSVATYQTVKDTPDTLRGQISTTTLKVKEDRIGFTIYNMAVNADMAESIDNYFTMYGYAIKKIKQPNVKSSTATLRPHWNYIKTRNCIIHSVTAVGLTAEDEADICKIFNNGITFWMDGDEVGDYSLDNSPA